MARGKIVIERIDDAKARMICFKKRRLNLVKKCMQLSNMTDCHIQIKILNENDMSLVQYQDDKNFDFAAW